MKLQPLGERIVIKPVEANKEATTKSGIILAGQSEKRPNQGEVVAVGPGGNVDGKEILMTVKVGDKVIYSEYSGTEVKFEDEKYVIVRQSDVLAIVK